MQGKTRGFKFKCVMALAVVLALFVLVPAGCGDNDSNDGNKDNASSQIGDDSNQPAQNQHEVTLYFSDEQAMYLLPEERTITSGSSLGAAVIEELINGPEKNGLVRTIPEGTKLLSVVTVANGVANVNFSKEFRNKHWGGSAGETMTLYSVVNSLGEVPGIEKVQFLLEGEKQESILNGNMDTTVPIEPDYNLVGK